MPRPKARLKRKVIGISATAQMQSDLERIKDTGLFGSSVTEAATRMVERGIEELIVSGRLKTLVERNKE